MADKAIFCKISHVQPNGTSGEMSMYFEVCYCADNGSVDTLSIHTEFLITDTLAAIRDKLAATIRSEGAAYSRPYDVSAPNSIIMPTFQKV